MIRTQQDAVTVPGPGRRFPACPPDNVPTVGRQTGNESRENAMAVQYTRPGTPPAGDPTIVQATTVRDNPTPGEQHNAPLGAALGVAAYGHMANVDRPAGHTESVNQIPDSYRPRVQGRGSWRTSSTSTRVTRSAVTAS